jgi:hypothetical protein
MRKRKRRVIERPSPTRARYQKQDHLAWNAPDFRFLVLIGLLFLTLPAVLMAALGLHGLALAWFAASLLGVGVLSRRQVRDFWRALRGGDSQPPGDKLS